MYIQAIISLSLELYICLIDRWLAEMVINPCVISDRQLLQPVCQCKIRYLSNISSSYS